MTRARPMTKADRAAMADALRHMNRSGVPYPALRLVAGVKVRLLYAPKKTGKGASS